MAKIIKIPSVFVYDTKVVGVSKENEDGSSRQKFIRREVVEGDNLLLKPEENNPYDPNAVRVFSKFGHQIGYLSRDMAEKVKPALDNGTEVQVKASCVSGDKICGVGLRIELVS
ncbi:MAG: HIRAN domain-containing protein [Bacteroidota bacterium]